MTVSDSDRGMAASAGGARAASGLSFQAEVFAWWAACAAAGVPPGLGLSPQSTVEAVGCETGFPVDDIGVALSDGGFILVQAKGSIRRLDSRAADITSAVDQIVDAMVQGVRAESGHRSVDVLRDRLMIATNRESSRSFDVLGTVCGRLRDHPATVQLDAVATSKDERHILMTFVSILESRWQAASGRRLLPHELRDLLRVVEVRRFDFAVDGGVDRLRCREMLANSTIDQPFAALFSMGLEAARTRTWRQRHSIMASVGLVEVEAAPPLNGEGRNWPVFAAAPLRGNEVTRPILILELLDAVKRADNDATRRVVGLQGAGGFGKSTMARLLAHRDDIRERFTNGVAWATLGDDAYGPKLAERINDIVYILTGVRPPLTDPLLAGAELGRAFGQRHLLLIIDDVWSDAQLEPFLQGGPAVVRLVTTRQRSVLPTMADIVVVDAMLPSEAREVLTEGLPDVSAQTVAEILDVTGRWPMLLTLINGAVRADLKGGRTVDQALCEIYEQMRSNGPDILDVADEQHRHMAVSTTIEISLARLNPGQRERYLELAIFPEDVDIPRSVLELYWSETGRWTPFQVHRFCQQITDMALAISYRHDPPRLRLHDVIRAWLRQQQRARLPKLYKSMVKAHRDLVGEEGGVTAWWRLPLEGTYLWTWMITFLYRAGYQNEVRRCLHHPMYFIGKLGTVGPPGLEADLSLADDSMTLTLQTVVRQNAHLFGPLTPEGSLAATVVSRLPDQPELFDFMRSFTTILTGPHIRPVFTIPDLPHPRLRRVLAGHAGLVSGLLASDDETILFSAGSDATVRIWNVETGDLLQTLPAPKNIHITFQEAPAAPDGTWSAHKGENNSVLIRDGQSGGVLHTLTGHTDFVLALKSAPDGGWLASASRDGTIRIWDPHHGKCTNILVGHTGYVSELAISPHGAWLASAGLDCCIRIWDPATGAIRHVMTGHTERVQVLLTGPGGRWIASGSGDGTVRIWDPIEGTCLQTFTGHSAHIVGAVSQLVASHDGTWLASAGFDGTVRLWNVSTGMLRDVMTGHSGWIGALTVSSDESWVASGGLDGKVRIWEIGIDTLSRDLLGHTGRVTNIVAAPDGSWIASTGDDGDIRIWDPQTGTYIYRLTGHQGWVGPAVVSPDSTWLATTGQDGTVRVWDSHAGTSRFVLTGNGMKSEALTMSPDGTWIASSCMDGAVRVWDPITGDMLHELEGGYGPLATGADGEWLAYADEGSTVHLWSMPDCSDMGTLSAVEKQDDDLTSPMLLTIPQHALLACASADAIYVWNVVRKTIVHTFAIDSNHETWPCALAADPNGRWLATSFHDGKIRVWNLETGQLNCALAGHFGEVSAIAFASNGSWLVSASEDGVLCIWDVVKGKPIAAIRVDDRLEAVVVCGSTLVAAGARCPYFFSFIVP